MEQEKFELALSINKDGLVETNVDEVIAAIKPALKKYNYIVTEETYATAKKEAAQLRKFAKRSQEERSRVENILLQDWKVSKAKLMALEKEITATADTLYSGVKEIDNLEAQKKQEELKELWIDMCEGMFAYDIVHNGKWLNKTTKPEAIKEEMAEKLKQLQTNLKHLEAVPVQNAASRKVVLDYFKASGNYEDASHRMMSLLKAEGEEEARRQAQIEAEKAKQAEPEQKPEPVQEVAQPVQNQPNTAPQATAQMLCRVWFTKGTPEQYNHVFHAIQECGLQVVKVVKDNNTIAKMYKEAN